MPSGNPKAGWGTVANRRLEVLLLGSPQTEALTTAMARAIAKRHRVTHFLSNPSGLTSWFSTARAAWETKPHIVQAVGAQGFAKMGGTIALGIRAPLIAHVRPDDLRDRPRPTRRLVRLAAAIVLQTSSDKEALQALGVERSVYVMEDLDDPDDDLTFVQALEVIYGRLLSRRASPETHPAEPEDAPLVTLGNSPLS